MSRARGYGAPSFAPSPRLYVFLESHTSFSLRPVLRAPVRLTSTSVRSQLPRSDLTVNSYVRYWILQIMCSIFRVVVLLSMRIKERTFQEKLLCRPHRVGNQRWARTRQWRCGWSPPTLAYNLISDPRLIASVIQIITSSNGVVDYSAVLAWGTFLYDVMKMV
jgi:hypothetical protein